MHSRVPVAMSWLLLLPACGGGAATVGDREPAAQGDWSCVTRLDASHGGAAAMVASLPPGQPFVVSLQDASSRAPVGGVELALCARADEDCASAVSRSTTDDRGNATLTAPVVPSSFDGFVRVSGSGIATHYAFLANRLAACPSCAFVVPLYTPSALGAVERMTGLSLGAHEGMVRAEVQDCAAAPAAGAAVSIGSFGCSEAGAAEAASEPGLPFRPGRCGKPVLAYSTGGEGRVSRLALGTDATGVALGFGVPPGPIGVAELLEGETVGGTVAFARAGAVSIVSVRPHRGDGD